MKRNSKTPLYQGMLGGGIVISFFLIILLSLNLFNYRVQINKVNINTVNSSDSTVVINEEDILDSHKAYRKQLFENLKKDRSILTPQEYTNNVVNYYNSILLILSLMLAAFSFLGFVYIKSQAIDIIDERINSDEFREDVVELLVGRAGDTYTESLNAISAEVKDLSNRMAMYAENNEDIDGEIEE